MKSIKKNNLKNKKAPYHIVQTWQSPIHRGTEALGWSCHCQWAPQ